MSVQVAMKSLGEVDGVRWFWAEPGLFTVPGVYYWDGNANVHVTATRAATVPQGVWLPIESAPRTGIAVLLFQPWKSGRNCAVIGHYANGWVGSDIEDLQPEPTHWQPLPTPPPAELGKGDLS